MSEVTRIKCGTGNCYLISDGSNAVLVDTGSKRNSLDVIQVCDKYKIRLIILTHVHFDHAENVKELSDRYHVPVMIHQDDEELFEDFDKQPLKAYGIVGKIILGISKKKLKNTKVEKPEHLIYVKEGESLNQFGISGKIIELPGHTKGSIGVDLGDAVIVGDAMDNWLCKAKGHLYHDWNAINESAKKIAQLGNRTIYYGHGNPT